MLNFAASPWLAPAMEDVMTVDMLAATFFWPEGTLLGAQHPENATDGAAPQTAFPDDDAPERDGFWAGVMRHLWRPAPAPSAAGPR
ncbi:hypothetical protein D3272_00380 [Lichenibacterium ramalinae]|uniref:Uncharacterized protein n=2 Tax=Lichenibacterium ramalinae TaxID=2316527 RepID=A0A4Q2RI02_9HYPH|nr:hypothetical protein D3272_00380 [Lichenibacterium ramalinae]